MNQILLQCNEIFLLYRAISEYYRDYVYPWTVPILLPVAQISMTASVYTTLVTCFDRYVAICRPALMGKMSNSVILESSFLGSSNNIPISLISLG